ncbi:hypothetical protein EIP91_005924 [Steccherinum ochraceum]|uniref:Uncharacterized protein n=1 Tax=Steccherinum ochraceum TaxID=92696 RepID=A0A4V2MXE8_9APHY|nr:hypothetical protein EIP91_005924 [Steccherinum ochraceum]
MRFTTAFLALTVSTCTFALAVPLEVTSRDIASRSAHAHDVSFPLALRDIIEAHNAPNSELESRLEKRKFANPTSGTITPPTHEVRPDTPPPRDSPSPSPDPTTEGTPFVAPPRTATPDLPPEGAPHPPLRPVQLGGTQPARGQAQQPQGGQQRPQGNQQRPQGNQQRPQGNQQPQGGPGQSGQAGGSAGGRS